MIRIGALRRSLSARVQEHFIHHRLPPQSIADTLLYLLNPSTAVVVEQGSTFQFVVSLTRSADLLVAAGMDQEEVKPTLLGAQQRLFAVRQRLFVPLTDDKLAVALLDMPDLPSAAALAAFQSRVNARAVYVSGTPCVRADDVVRIHSWASSSFSPDGGVVRLLPSHPIPHHPPNPPPPNPTAGRPNARAAAARGPPGPAAPQTVLDLTGGAGVVGLVAAAAGARGTAAPLRVDVRVSDASAAHELIALGAGDANVAAARAAGVELRYLIEDGTLPTASPPTAPTIATDASAPDAVVVAPSGGGRGEYDLVVSGHPLVGAVAETLRYPDDDQLQLGDPTVAPAGFAFGSGPPPGRAHAAALWPPGWVPGAAAGAGARVGPAPASAAGMAVTLATAGSHVSIDGQVVLLETVVRGTGADGADSVQDDTASGPAAAGRSSGGRAATQSHAQSPGLVASAATPGLLLSDVTVRGHAGRPTAVSGWYVRPFARAHLRGYDGAASPAQLRHNLSDGIPGVQVMFTERGVVWRRTSQKEVAKRYQENIERHKYSPQLVTRFRPRPKLGPEFGSAMWRDVVYPTMCAAALVVSVLRRVAATGTPAPPAAEHVQSTETDAATAAAAIAAAVAARAARRGAPVPVSRDAARRMLAAAAAARPAAVAHGSAAALTGASSSDDVDVFTAPSAATVAMGGAPSPSASTLRPAAVCPRCGAGFFSVADRDAHVAAFHASPFPAPAADATEARPTVTANWAAPFQQPAAEHLCVGHQFGYCTHAIGSEAETPRKAPVFGEVPDPVRCVMEHSSTHCALCGEPGHLGPSCDLASAYVNAADALRGRELSVGFATRRSLVTSQWLHVMGRGWSHYASRTAGKRSGGRPMYERWGSGVREGINSPIRGSGVTHATGKVHWMKNFGALDSGWTPSPIGTRYRHSDPMSEIS